MAYNLRYQESEWAMHHVVSRCINGYSFLKPTPEITRICAGVLGRSLTMYSERIRLTSMTFLSNHFHLLLESRDIHSLSAFMQYLKSNLSRELARVHEWQGPMWQSRYSSEQILDQESFDKALKYMMENSVKESLVGHPRAWPGLHGFRQIIDRAELSGPWVDRTALYQAKRNPKTRDHAKEEDFTTSYQVKLEKPHMLAELSEEEYYERCVKICNEAIESARAKRERPPMGAAKVLAQPVLRAKKLKRSRRPLCRANTVELIKAYKAKYKAFKRAFQAAYRHARDQVIAGERSVEMLFPVGGIAPLSVIGLSELSDPPQLE